MNLLHFAYGALQQEDRPMIKLYQFEPAFGLANASPFCMKLETYLRMADLPFEIPCARLSHRAGN